MFFPINLTVIAITVTIAYGVVTISYGNYRDAPTYGSNKLSTPICRKIDPM